MIDMVDVIEDEDRCVLGNSLSFSLFRCVYFTLGNLEFILSLLAKVVCVCVCVLRKCSASDALIFAGRLAMRGTGRFNLENFVVGRLPMSRLPLRKGRATFAGEEGDEKRWTLGVYNEDFPSRALIVFQYAGTLFLVQRPVSFRVAFGNAPII